MFFKENGYAKQKSAGIITPFSLPVPHPRLIFSPLRKIVCKVLGLRPSSPLMAEKPFMTTVWSGLRQILTRTKNTLDEGPGSATVFAAFCGVVFLLSVGHTAYAFLQPLAVQTTGTLISATLPHDWEGRTNVLLLGVGDKNHAAANLTDTIIVASIQPSTRSISMLSLPRDLYLTDTTEVENSRINALYSNYWSLHSNKADSPEDSSILALKSVAEEIGKRLDLPIHGVVKVDFTAFENIIDAMGGIEIDVPEDLTDYTYPLEEGKVGTFSVKAGPQRMNGETALRYARSRHSTSDFDRAARQQLILRAALQRAGEQNIVDDMRLLRPVLESLADHVQWTFSAPELVTLAGAVFSVPMENIVSMHLNAATGWGGAVPAAGGFIQQGAGTGIASGAILIPYSLSGRPSDWGQIKTAATMLFSHRDLYLAHPFFTLSADPAAMEQARKLRNELSRYGFTVREKIGRKTIAGTGSMVMDAWKQPSFFEEAIDLPVESAMTGSGILLEIGKKYRFTPLEHRLFPAP